VRAGKLRRWEDEKVGRWEGEKVRRWEGGKIMSVALEAK
jgi:hypothetical protein